MPKRKRRGVVGKRSYKFAAILGGGVFFFPLYSITPGKLMELDPQYRKRIELQEKRMEETGYADIEFDNIHRKITKLLPRLQKLIEKDEKGNFYFKIPIAFGESIKGVGERYIYNGEALLYTNRNGTTLNRVIFSFWRASPVGHVYKEEKRELINPTPRFDPEGKKIDSNTDWILVYYEREDEKAPFVEKWRTIFKDIPFFDKKKALLETYKKYLRKTLFYLTRKVADEDLKLRRNISHFMDFE